MIIALASGGQYPEGDRFEHVRSYLRAFFNFLGIEPEFVDVSGVALGADMVLADAEQQIVALAA